MRKTLTLLTLLICSVSVFADKVTSTDVKTLPENAQQFITTYFKDLKIKKIEVDDAFLEAKVYEVEFTNGYEVEFDSKGNWFQVDFQNDQLPAALVPEKIAKYIKSNFPGDFITEIEVRKNGYEVELQSDISIEFDKNQKFKRIDH